VLIWADGGYAGKLIDWVADLGHWILQIVKRCDDVKGFVVLPRRWVVERTFSWLGKYRRLSNFNLSSIAFTNPVCLARSCMTPGGLVAIISYFYIMMAK